MLSLKLTSQPRHGIRSLREFDDRITALYSATSADDYYDRPARRV
jgi:predicted alpha/beta-fold hydrolase